MNSNHMEFSKNTVALLQKVVGFVRKHPMFLDDEGLASDNAMSIVLRVLSEPRVVYDYNPNGIRALDGENHCKYVHKHGQKRGKACTSAVDASGHYCPFHNNPIFTGELHEVFAAAFNKEFKEPVEVNIEVWDQAHGLYRVSNRDVLIQSINGAPTVVGAVEDQHKIRLLTPDEMEWCDRVKLVRGVMVPVDPQLKRTGVLIGQ
jgi:hypothetical protein